MYTFLDEYRDCIRPRIREIDTFLRLRDEYCTGCVAEILSLCEEEVVQIMNEVGLKKIDRQSFMDIMQRGSSRICQLYAREVALHSPYVYTSDDIAYIYNLDLQAVKNAYQILKIKEVTAFTMPLVFGKIAY